MSAILLDTNVLVYAWDPGDGEKQERAQQLLRDLQPDGNTALSAQVLGEFFRVVTGKLSPPVPAGDAHDLVAWFSQSFKVWAIDEMVVMEAARGVRDHRLSYWDAQIWATARLRGGRIVLSEDFQDGLVVEGITFVDPFTADFQAERLRGGASR